VRARDLPPATTSSAAAAIWSPYLVEDTRVLRWSELTRLALTEISDGGEPSVQLQHGLEASREEKSPPDWMIGLPDFRAATPGELPAGFRTGWWYTTPVVDMPRYLDYLARRLADAGGKIQVGTVDSLEAVLDETQTVVNCTGIDARDLVPDGTMVPVRGQLVVVPNPGLDRFFAEHDESPAPTYYLPHGDFVVLGGTAEEGNTDRRPDSAAAQAILARCAEIQPAFRGLDIVEVRVGLRPNRPAIRVERVAVGAGYLVHNYGHGGAGVTASWGCADEVLRLVRAEP
jgi:D-amino-acid oxidase